MVVDVFCAYVAVWKVSTSHHRIILSKCQCLKQGRLIWMAGNRVELIWLLSCLSLDPRTILVQPKPDGDVFSHLQVSVHLYTHKHTHPHIHHVI